MIIEPGKSYKTREGYKVKILGISPFISEDIDCFVAAHAKFTTTTYHQDGSWNGYSESPEDLVEELETDL